MTVRTQAALVRAREQPGAFAEFYSEHSTPVLVFFAQRVYEPEVALELTAETFAQAFLRRRSFRGDTDGEAAAWLFGIAGRQLTLYFRRQRVERRGINRLGIQVPTLGPDDLERLEDLADLTELREVVSEELDRLSAVQQQVLELRVVQEKPYSEISQELAITEDAARARATRGLKALSEALTARIELHGAGT